MRTLALTTVLSIIVAAPVLCQEPAAEEPVVSGVAFQDSGQSTAASEVPQLLPRRFSLNLEAHFGPILADSNPFSDLSIRHEREWRQALWNAPMGRLYYELAEQQSMLGREGLVGGGHMLGLGLGTTAIGDGSQGMQLRMNGYSWSELSHGERFKIGLQGALAASILYAVFNNLD